MPFSDQPIGTFLDSVASGAVTPSGGAVAAVSGAAGAALCEMVCLHTIGTSGYEEVEGELTDVAADLAADRGRLLELADDDATAVDRMGAAFDTHGESDRATAKQEALKRATAVPLETAEVCLAVLDHGAVVTEIGTDTAVADAMTGVFLAHGALRAVTWTARANLGLIDDDAFVSDRRQRLAELERAGSTAFERAKAAGTERGL
jgi:formiminotetrahydrofolate cyclodeaminase